MQELKDELSFLRDQTLLHDQKLDALWGIAEASLTAMSGGISDINLKISALESARPMDTQSSSSAIQDKVNTLLMKVDSLQINSEQRDARLQAMLMSKPSLLREACDRDKGSLAAGLIQARKNEEEFIPLHPKRTLKKFRLCKCQEIEQCHQDSYRLRWPKTFLSWTTTRCHDRHCPFHQWERRVSVRIYISYLLCGAVRASFNIKQGAGGTSISPLLRYHPIVPNNSPAFKVISSGRSTAKLSLTRMRQLFEKGEASPFDINERGQTLLMV